MTSDDTTRATRYLCWGRLCQCGERITTWRIAENERLEPAAIPLNCRFHCKNGHVHFLSPEQAIFGPLQWTEEE